MNRPTGSLLGGLTPRRFLRRHWQKRPLLVRRALPGFRDPLSRSGLLELATRDEVESRLVLERGGRRPWQVVPGPQRSSRLRKLGRTHWTLLVQEANRHVPALAELLDLFSFVPRWRVDDVMVSFAPRHGTVGAHVDSYDVFLLQGGGRRRWQIARRFDPSCREGLDLSVLRRFRPEEEWVLEPGDMLYLPPGVAHRGVALADCFTYSIGFRAPSRADLAVGFAELVARGPDAARYADPDLAPTRHPGALSARAVTRLRHLLAGALAAPTRDEFARFAGRLLTRPALEIGGPSRRLRPPEIRSRLSRSSGLLRSETSRLAYVTRGRRGAVLFVDGVAHDLPPRLAFAGPLLADRRFVPRAELESRLRAPGFVAFLGGLVGQGVFRFVR
jgi:50S ribosomal protein L16 3-hydroxylase